MTTRNDAIEAYREYVDTVGKLEREHEASLASLKENDNKYGKRTRLLFTVAAGMYFGAGIAVVVSLITGIEEIGNASMYPFIASFFVIAAGLLQDKKSGMESASKENMEEAKNKLLCAFYSAIASEMRSNGLKILNFNIPDGFITTDRGIITVATTEGSREPIILLNGSPVRSTYLSDVQELVDLKGNTVHASKEHVTI